mmetsp:Transcript_71722/g.156100  ORF Transcript_71722/g.156100 Transcript_71722/m.156100 type:complete len:261 (-) Transcript_71722:173-955(-)
MPWEARKDWVQTKQLYCKVAKAQTPPMPTSMFSQYSVTVCFSLETKVSCSGKACNFSFISKNMPDSGTCLRPMMAIMPGMMASQNGTRQAHCSTASAPKAASTMNVTAFAERKPRFTVMAMRETPRQSMRGEQTSVKNVVIVTISPAALKPWMNLRTTKRTSPRSPSHSAPLIGVGRQPWPTVPTSMPTMEMFTAVLLPHRSPTTPRTMPPKGRAKKVTPKPNQSPIAEPLKKFFSKDEAKWPYMAYSYHSTMLPSSSDQ